ncbi:hypothetical protein [Nocardia terpenica]|uniref:hypothetical protein n=1 Tax=Nocardia terpenica TaxID=455432 RepID=UPI0012FD1B6F|nr:hypothetical protein [Nocardia terpenica]
MKVDILCLLTRYAPITMISTGLAGAADTARLVHLGSVASTELMILSLLALLAVVRHLAPGGWQRILPGPRCRACHRRYPIDGPTERGLTRGKRLHRAVQVTRWQWIVPLAIIVAITRAASPVQAAALTCLAWPVTGAAFAVDAAHRHAWCPLCDTGTSPVSARR